MEAIVVVGGVTIFKWNCVVSLALTSCVTLGKSILTSQSEFSHFSNKDNNGLSEMVVVMNT